MWRCTDLWIGVCRGTNWPCQQHGFSNARQVNKSGRWFRAPIHLPQDRLPPKIPWFIIIMNYMNWWQFHVRFFHSITIRNLASISFPIVPMFFSPFLPKKLVAPPHFLDHPPAPSASLGDLRCPDASRTTVAFWGVQRQLELDLTHSPCRSVWKLRISPPTGYLNWKTCVKPSQN